jgi:hypothetical protein
MHSCSFTKAEIPKGNPPISTRARKTLPSDQFRRMSRPKMRPWKMNIGRCSAYDGIDFTCLVAGLTFHSISIRLTARQ